MSASSGRAGGLKRHHCARSGGHLELTWDQTVAQGAVESSAAVDRQAAHRGCGQQGKPTFAPPDGFDEEDDAYLAPLPPANDVRAQGEGGDFRWPQVGTFTWPRASGVKRMRLLLASA